MKIIKKTYEELDFFGQSFSLNIDGNYTIKTSFGSFLGLCFIGLVLISIWLIGNDIIYHKKPQLNVQDDFERKTGNSHKLQYLLVRYLHARSRRHACVLR
jgi:hypothetical protein